MNGEEAFQMVKRNVEENNGDLCIYELILMDCNMPVMDGYESSLKIRSYLQSFSLPQPIIIAVTGHTGDSFLEKAY